jgi:citrate lyase subunit beta/citryl-CoA lyase
VSTGRTPRSYLYVPGDRPDRFDKAERSGADAIIFDLEDAVGLAHKNEARSAVSAHLARPSTPGLQRWVRVNTGSRGADDIAALASCDAVDGIIVPKATVEAVHQLRAPVRFGVIALIESAQGILDCVDIARHDIVDRLMIGEVDLVADLGLEISPGAGELEPYRAALVLASAAAGRDQPVAGVHLAIGDHADLDAETRAAKRRGFGARQAIHPDQIPVIHTAFLPAPDEIDRARELIHLVDAAGGGVVVDANGRMVDEAVLRSARRTVTAAEPTD